MGQSWTAVAVILGIVALVVVLLFASCALGSHLEAKRDNRATRAREREGGGGG